MKVTFTESIDAKLVVTARLGPDGDFSAIVAGICAYGEDQIEGAACSAHVDIPAELAQQIRAAMEAARTKVMGELGPRLAQSRSLAIRIAVDNKELAP